MLERKHRQVLGADLNCSEIWTRTQGVTDMRNVPPLEQRVEQLEAHVKAMREALAHVMGVMLPAFQALEHLEDAARACRDLTRRTNRCDVSCLLPPLWAAF
jgi:hypothetical protein